MKAVGSHGFARHQIAELGKVVQQRVFNLFGQLGSNEQSHLRLLESRQRILLEVLRTVCAQEPSQQLDYLFGLGSQLCAGRHQKAHKLQRIGCGERREVDTRVILEAVLLGQVKAKGVKDTGSVL